MIQWAYSTSQKFGPSSHFFFSSSNQNSLIVKLIFKVQYLTLMDFLIIIIFFFLYTYKQFFDKKQGIRI